MYLTLEESTTVQVSPVLNEIVKRILAHSNSSDAVQQKDFLFVLILVLMTENGFSSVKKNGVEVIDTAKVDVKQLTEWRTSEGANEAMFIMNGFENISLKLIMSPLGSTVLVNLVISDLNSETYSVCLPVSRYVVSPQASTIPMIFRDLKHLSITFKNKVLASVKSRILSFYGYPSASLMGVPEELFFKIIAYLSLNDVVNVTKTCKRLKFLMENQSIWHELLKRDFNHVTESEVNNWKELYKEHYSRQQNTLRPSRRNAGTLHDYMDYSDLISYVDNPMWDVLM